MPEVAKVASLDATIAQHSQRISQLQSTYVSDLNRIRIDALAQINRMEQQDGKLQFAIDQQPYLQGFLPVLQCVLTAKYKMPGLSVNTAAGAVTADTIDSLAALIDAGIR